MYYGADKKNHGVFWKQVHQTKSESSRPSAGSVEGSDEVDEGDGSSPKLAHCEHAHCLDQPGSPSLLGESLLQRNLLQSILTPGILVVHDPRPCPPHRAALHDRKFLLDAPPLGRKTLCTDATTIYFGYTLVGVFVIHLLLGPSGFGIGISGKCRFDSTGASDGL
ncbi:hypothetical protein Ocin01_11138, partial [Orchesella cincta]